MASVLYSADLEHLKNIWFYIVLRLLLLVKDALSIFFSFIASPVHRCLALLLIIGNLKPYYAFLNLTDHLGLSVMFSHIQAYLISLDKL